MVEKPNPLEDDIIETYKDKSRMLLYSRKNQLHDIVVSFSNKYYQSFAVRYDKNLELLEISYITKDGIKYINKSKLN